MMHCADTSLFSEFELTPLHVAVLNNYHECVSILLNHGADASLCTKNEYSPLHIAVAYDYNECVSILLKHGADASLCNTCVRIDNNECTRMTKV